MWLLRRWEQQSELLRVGFGFYCQSNSSALIKKVHFSLPLMPGCRHSMAVMAGSLLLEVVKDPGFYLGVPPSRVSISQVMPPCPHPDTGGEELEKGMFPSFKDTSWCFIKYSTHIPLARLSHRATLICKGNCTLYSVQWCAQEEGRPVILGQIAAFAILSLGWLWVNL